MIGAGPRPPDALVDVGGHRLHIMCAGAGFAGRGHHPCHRCVLGRVAEGSGRPGCPHGRVRVRPAGPGLERSGGRVAQCCGHGAGSPLPARDRAGCAAVGPRRPFHGRSCGLDVRAQYPDEVAGLALVDSSHPDRTAGSLLGGSRITAGGKLAEVALDFARPLGLRRLRQGQPGDAPGSLRAVIARPPGGREGTARDRTRSAARPAGPQEISASLPLAVISSSERDPGYPEGSRRQRGRSRFYEGWIQLQDELAELSADSVHVVAADAGHHLNRDDPELVARRSPISCGEHASRVARAADRRPTPATSQLLMAPRRPGRRLRGLFLPADTQAGKSILVSMRDSDSTITFRLRKSCCTPRPAPPHVLSAVSAHGLKDAGTWAGLDPADGGLTARLRPLGASPNAEGEPISQRPHCSRRGLSGSGPHRGCDVALECCNTALAQ